MATLSTSETIVNAQPFTIDTEAEAKAYLTALLAKPEFRSMNEIEMRCAKVVREPAIQVYFLAIGAKMLAAARGPAS